MPFTTKLNLSNEKFEQQSGSTLNLAGNTIIEGDLRYDVVPTITGDTQIVTKQYVDDAIIAVSGGSSGFYTGATPSTVTVGGLNAGTQLTGRTANDILEEMLVVYLEPAFTAFSVTGQATTVESGTQLTGNRTFTWTISNGSNVQSNSIGIRDVTSGTTLATGLANDGSELVAINTRTIVNAAETQVWAASGTNTQAGTFNSSNFTVTARYLRFYGPASSDPTNSAEVRALPSNAFQTANANTFTLNTGAVETTFYVALPPGRTIASVIDTSALNADITSEYVLQGTINVNDGGGTGTVRSYNLYKMEIGAPYSSSHAHSITTA